MAPGKPDNNGVRGVALWIIVLGVTLAGLLVALNASLISTATPTITTYFHSLDDLGWYGTAYLLSNCSLIPLAGVLYKNASVKWTFLAFLGLFEVGCAIAGGAPSSHALIVGRAISGCGAAGIINGAVSIISAVAPLHKRPALIGIAVSMSGIGSVLGPVLGGFITQHASWRWCFFVNVVVGGAVALLLAFVRIPKPESKQYMSFDWPSIHEKLDFVGLLLFEPPCIMFLLAVCWGGEDKYDWGSATIIGLLVASFIMACGFVAWEFRQGSVALIPMPLMRVRPVVFGCVTSFLSMGPLLMLTYYVPIWFQAVKGASPTASGIMLLPMALSQMVSAIVSGSIIQRTGYFTPWAIAGSAISAIGTGLFSTWEPWTGEGTWIGYQILVGAGRGMVIQISILAAQSALPQDQIDIGSALVMFFQYFGGTLFVTFGQTIFSYRLRAVLLHYAPGVDPPIVVSAGAYGLRAAFTGREYDGVVMAYNAALTSTFYLATAGGALAFFTSFGLGWKNIKKAKQAKQQETCEHELDTVQKSVLESRNGTS